MDGDLTQWLVAWRNGDATARERLATSLYPELQRLARQAFRREPAGHTLQPTALVNEAWLRLVGNGVPSFTDRTQLVAAAAHLMREILVDHARRRNAVKRDGGLRVTLSHCDAEDADGRNLPDLLDLDRALTRLEAIDPVKASIVELRYFGGLSIEETGAAVALSPATVKRHWQAARAWLHAALQDTRPPADQ